MEMITNWTRLGVVEDDSKGLIADFGKCDTGHARTDEEERLVVECSNSNQKRMTKHKEAGLSNNQAAKIGHGV